jgi:hypothetical protein
MDESQHLFWLSNTGYIVAASALNLPNRMLHKWTKTMPFLGPLRGRLLVRMTHKPVTSGLSYSALRKNCLDAVRQWPGCETVAGVQIIRQNDGRFSVPVTLCGSADRSIEHSDKTA